MGGSSPLAFSRLRIEAVEAEHEVHLPPPPPNRNDPGSFSHPPRGGSLPNDRSALARSERIEEELSFFTRGNEEEVDLSLKEVDLKDRVR